MKLNAKKKKQATEGKKIYASYYDVIKTPVITEKSTLLGEKGKVVFNVCQKASKDEIKAAVEALFGVTVKSVNTLNRKGKAKGFRGKAGMRSDSKKAIVTVAEGQSIDLAQGAK